MRDGKRTDPSLIEGGAGLETAERRGKRSDRHLTERGNMADRHLRHGDRWIQRDGREG